MAQTIVYTSVGNVCVDSTGMRDTNTRDKKKRKKNGGKGRKRCRWAGWRGKERLVSKKEFDK